LNILKPADANSSGNGSPRDLARNCRKKRTRVLRTGIAGEWRDLGDHKQYRATTGAVLNWWQSTGAISFQGVAAEEFEAKLFLRAAGEDDREIIPPQLLRGLTLDRVDWERSTLIDDDTSAVFLRPVFEPVDERV